MRIYCLLILISFGNGIKSQIMFQFKNDSVYTYEYADGDEFNSDIINLNKWKIGLPWSRVIMSQDIAFTPENVIQKNGLINFIANKEDSVYRLGVYEIDSVFIKKNKITLNENNEFLTKYAVGCIVSKNKYHYGIHEIRFKVEEGQGVWPAFWFFGGVKNEEIDVFELKGEKNNKIHVDTHCPYGCDKGYKNKIGVKTNWGGWMPVNGYLHDGFNIMALEWRNDELIWIINGFPLAYFKGKFDNPMNLYLNTSVAKDGGAFKPGPGEKSKWPNTFAVDYYRYWKPTPSNEGLFLKKDKEFNVSEQSSSVYSLKPTKKRGLMFKKNKLNSIDGNLTISQLSDHLIIISVMGELKNTGIKIEGLTTKNNYAVNAFNSENRIDIDKMDKQLNCTFTTDKVKYTYTVTLQ